MILWKGAFSDPSGYGHAARGYLFSLYKLGADIKAFEKKHDCMDVDLTKEQKKIIDDTLVREIPSNAHVIIHHCTPEFYERHPNRYNISYCAWEVSKIPDLWVNKINETMDKVWVPCSHNKRVFEDCGVTRPIEIIPHGIDTNFFKPNLRPLKIVNLKKFTFLSVFQWTERKAWKTLLRAYFKAFRPEEDVCLILKVYRSNVSLPEQRAIKRDIELIKRELGMIKTPAILFYGNLLSNDLLPHLYNTCDCFVLPSRGEGFGLPFAEAMACGKPCIATNWSSMPDFVNKDNGYPLDYKLVSVQHMPHTPWYNENQKWAEPKQEHLVNLMRRVFSDGKELKVKGEKSRITIERFYSWNKIAQQIMKNINSIRGV